MQIYNVLIVANMLCSFQWHFIKACDILLNTDTFVLCLFWSCGQLDQSIRFNIMYTFYTEK